MKSDVCLSRNRKPSDMLKIRKGETKSKPLQPNRLSYRGCKLIEGVGKNWIGLSNERYAIPMNCRGEMKGLPVTSKLGTQKRRIKGTDTIKMELIIFLTPSIFLVLSRYQIKGIVVTISSFLAVSVNPKTKAPKWRCFWKNKCMLSRRKNVEIVCDKASLHRLAEVCRETSESRLPKKAVYTLDSGF